jgi:hypothetical protein
MLEKLVATSWSGSCLLVAALQLTSERPTRYGAVVAAVIFGLQVFHVISFAVYKHRERSTGIVRHDRGKVTPWYARLNLATVLIPLIACIA